MALICRHMLSTQIPVNVSIGWLRVSVRRTHWKFRAVQTKQQSKLIDKMLTTNDKDSLLAKLMDNKPHIVSKGSPVGRQTSTKIVRHVNDRFETRRMAVLNKQLMQSISDVLSTEQIGDELNDLQVTITQVRVNRRCDLTNVFWISKCEDTERVAEMLDQMKGRLRHYVMDRNLMNSVPWIQFVLDVTENHCLEVERILETCDFGPDFEPSDQKLFETPYERIGRDNDKKMTGKSSKTTDICDDSVYNYVTLRAPNDMQMDCLGLKYDQLMNIVLANLNKSRAQHRSFNAVADPLPPPDWSAHIPVSVPQTDAIYNTDERIRVMKKFLVENRKKNERLSRSLNKQLILNEMQINCQLSDSYDIYHQNIEDLNDDHSYEDVIDSSDELNNESNEHNDR